jgi:hypothetical protein
MEAARAAGIELHRHQPVALQHVENLTLRLDPTGSGYQAETIARIHRP